VAIIKALDFAEVQNGNLTVYEVKNYGRKIIEERSITPIAQLDFEFEKPKTVPLSDYEALEKSFQELEKTLQEKEAHYTAQLAQVIAEHQQMDADYQELKGKTDYLTEARIRAEEAYNSIKGKMKALEDARIEAETQRILANREMATVRGDLLTIKNSTQRSDQEARAYLQTVNELREKLAATEKGVALLRETNETLRLENDRLSKEIEEMKANTEEEPFSPIDIPEASKEKQKHRVHFLKINGSRQRVDVIQPT
jgi:chromosome segregation ATPase